MKKHYALTLLFTSTLCSSLWAQSPKAINHEKKVVTKEGKTYVQKSLPLYLSFSTSPNGEKHTLNSESTKEYANPMYLDTEGINYIRSHWAVDQKTLKTIEPKVEIRFELYADGLAPRTSLGLKGAPSFSSSGVLYFGKGLSATLSSSDGVSGVEATNYSLNGSAYSSYANAVGLAKEGTNSFSYYAFDYVGNAENAKKTDFTVDLSSPSSSHSIEGISYQGNILSPSTKFALSSSDNLSGVNKTRYNFDGKGNGVYSAAISLNGLGDGEHTLSYHSTDNVNNEEGAKSFSFYLDKIAPEPTHAINGDQYQGNYLYVSSRTTVSLSATDNHAGIKNIEYKIDSDSYGTYGSALSIPNVSGLHNVRYRSTDNVENRSVSTLRPLYMDNTAPSTGINYGSPQFFDRDTLFINKDTEVSLRKSDAHSGLQKTEYKVDGGALKNYEVFTIPNEGNRVIGFFSTDRVNNKEAQKESKVFVDNTGPEIYINFSIQQIGSKEGLAVYPNYTRLYIGATDKHCGTEEIMYSINGEALRAYSSPYSLDISEVSLLKSAKKYSVRVVGKDKLGNSSEKTVDFFIEK
jgi:hypothetical protein